MKKLSKTLLRRAVCTALVLSVFTQSKAQTTLTAGDIAFTGYNSNDGGGVLANEFSFVILRTGGISSGTTINFTDNGWNPITNALGTTEGSVTWTATSALPQFTQVRIKVNTTGNGITTVSTGTATIGAANFILSQGGDQVLAYQGSAASPVFISGIHMNSEIASGANQASTAANWDIVATGGWTMSINRSGIPPALTNSVNAIMVVPTPGVASAEKDNGVYSCTGSTGASISAIRSAINNVSNWTIQDITPYAIPPGCSFALGSPASITTHPSATSTCSGNNASFTVTAANATGYQWQVDQGSGFTNIANGPSYSGVTTASLTITGATTGMSGNQYRVVVSGSTGSPATSNAATFTVNPAGLAGTAGGAAGCTSGVVGGATLYASGCNAIATILPSGASPVAGSINSCSKIEAAVTHYNGQPYVQRHYDIHPATNAATATATITLYFSDAEFVNYNAGRGTYLPLPTVAGGGNADPNKANVRISQFHGASSGSYLPGSYSGSAKLIVPTTNNIVYNASMSRWEITFDIAGFSGFFVSTGTNILPVKIESFTINQLQGANRLSWKISCTGTEAATVVIEKSNDGTQFNSIGTVASDNGCHQPGEHLDKDVQEGITYYRLRITEPSGAVSYSPVKKIVSAGNTETVSVFASASSLMVQIVSAATEKMTLVVSDMQGRKIATKEVQLQKGKQTVTIDIPNSLPGTYQLSGYTNSRKPLNVAFVKMQ